MTAASVITSFIGADDFAQYEQNIYAKYQEIAERQIITQLNPSFDFLYLKVTNFFLF